MDGNTCTPGIRSVTVPNASAGFVPPSSAPTTAWSRPRAWCSAWPQADTEQADLERERLELAAGGTAERDELTGIYVERGLEPGLARQVAEQLMAHDALAAHARDELGISEAMSARPVQAAFTSAASFAVGAVFPLAVASLTPGAWLVPMVGGTSLAFLGVLGGLAARAGGARTLVGAGRVVLWGALAMALTAAIGKLFGTVAA